MKKTFKKFLKGFLAVTLSVSLLTACSSGENHDKTGGSDIGQSNSEEQNSPDTSDSSNAGDVSATGADVKYVGNFTTQDVSGNAVTQDIFKEHELTMVNVFTTWCSPCVGEMPDLKKLHQQMKDKNVGVIGVVLDVLNEKGEIVDEDLERAQLLVKETGVTYPVLLPDSTYFNNRLVGIEAVPETFFVDNNGNIVGESYSGSGGLEDWIEVVERELANLKEGA